MSETILNNRYVLAVNDLKRSSAYYSTVLGFTIYQVGDPFWLFAKKDNCIIMLGECGDAQPPAQYHNYFAYLEVNDADAYYEQISGQGAKILQNPEDKEHGMREFLIETIDGHRIMIGSEK